MSRRAASPGALLRRYAADEGGVYTIEFAFFGALLILLLMALIQYGMIFTARRNLDSALQIATRSLLTGSFQNAGTNALDQASILAKLRGLMCGTQAAPTAFYTCDNLKIDVQIASSFSSAGAASAPVDSQTGTWSKGFGTSYTCPSPKSIATVRAAVKLPLFLPMFKLGFGGFSGNAALLQSAAVFRVEPYQYSGSGRC